MRASAQSSGTRIEIVDSGPGVPAGEREAVLRRFYRSRTTSGDGEGEGTGYGLGLSVVAAIAKLHGYCLEIGDNAGGGARMTLYCWQCAIAGARSA